MKSGPHTPLITHLLQGNVAVERREKKERRKDRERELEVNELCTRLETLKISTKYRYIEWLLHVA